MLVPSAYLLKPKLAPSALMVIPSWAPGASLLKPTYRKAPEVGWCQLAKIACGRFVDILKISQSDNCWAIPADEGHTLVFTGWGWMKSLSLVTLSCCEHLLKKICNLPPSLMFSTCIQICGFHEWKKQGLIFYPQEKKNVAGVNVHAIP